MSTEQKDAGTAVLRSAKSKSPGGTVQRSLTRLLVLICFFNERVKGKVRRELLYAFRTILSSQVGRLEEDIW
ncbi:hypothetical protein NQZ68_022954 [Dissostichus eleginoides]|nr:hypothetical protein NQZ68_022954 [Dissostichus eleginoides]